MCAYPHQAEWLTAGFEFLVLLIYWRPVCACVRSVWNRYWPSPDDSNDSIHSAALTGSALLCMGAGGDMDPVDLPYRQFIFVDALPAKPHYTPGTNGYPFYKDKAAFLNTIEAQLRDRLQSREQLSPDIYRFYLSEGKVLTYFINTDTASSHKLPEISELLPFVEGLFIRGNAPVEFRGELPFLSTVYATALCLELALEKRWFRAIQCSRGLTIEEVEEKDFDKFIAHMQ
ncbi:hypothetical protein WJX72_007122 [[Myrmecia] bisecta]|uniref:Uncharacterized protein n=1 Tax=[Myrmecia] bisecta TaxID=41462 RepID=A0AAW1PLS2_9CHLO